MAAGADRRQITGPGVPPKAGLVLASRSPRRRDLLRQIGLDFEIRPAGVDETPLPGEAPDAMVRRLAMAKAAAVAREVPDAAVLGADTIVVSPAEDGRRVFGKPRDRRHFEAMFDALAGRRHQVLTAVALIAGGRTRTRLASARVTFRDIGKAEMNAYWATGEPRDKAGGYGLQGVGAVFVAAIEGSHGAVIGLPLREVDELLAESGVDTWRGRGAS